MTPHYYYQQQQRYQTHRQPGLIRSFFAGLWYALVTALALMGLVAVVVAAYAVQTRGLPTLRPTSPVRLIPTVESIGLPEKLQFSTPEAEPTPVIYLNREGGTLTAGPYDDSSRNISTVVTGASLLEFEVPAFRGTTQRWNDVVSCVQRNYEPYEVDVVDQRPVDRPYVMVMVGGEPGPLVAANGNRNTNARRITGLAPMSERPINNAIVYVFSRSMRERMLDTCETITHEAGHAFGLDHVLDPRDPMTHLPRVARRSFQDRTTVCGERDPRACYNGQPAQNSHQQLLDVLGPNVD